MLFLLVSLVYATDKSSLSSLDCLSSIVDRITSSEQAGLPLQDSASLSPVASTDSQPVTPGASSSRLVYHVLWTTAQSPKVLPGGLLHGRRKEAHYEDSLYIRIPFSYKFVNIILPLYKKVYLTKSHNYNSYFLFYLLFFIHYLHLCLPCFRYKVIIRLFLNRRQFIKGNLLQCLTYICICCINIVH